MSTLFVPQITAALGAVTETLSLFVDIAILLFGVRLFADILTILEKAYAVFLKIAGFVQLITMLLLSVVGDVAPVAGRYAGRIAGRCYRYSRQIAAKIVEVYQSENVQSLISIAEYKSRQFVSEQFGDMLPQISQKIAPAKVMFIESDFLTAFQSFTRRELLAYAKDAGLPGYSRMTTEQLREAIATV
jgi:hypothetical protein